MQIICKKNPYIHSMSSKYKFHDKEDIYFVIASIVSLPSIITTQQKRLAASGDIGVVLW